ncbi:hypothetical protein N3K66_000486 [Trichothecium roseum]|uniref:Uncharacterized protein n=1 Tax=Trichothecium roseum TaxID=47278 RepID=A0ACC0VBY7_9HYPO|nr:hypothetical protein N3K66_000486 [Trichothecium roseum]
MSPAVPPNPAPDQESSATNSSDLHHHHHHHHHRDSGFPVPKLRLEIHDLTHPGASLFLDASHNASSLLLSATHDVLSTLYLPPSDQPPAAAAAVAAVNPPPSIRSVTLILRDMPGVAHTCGTDLDPAYHKEIHLSLRHLHAVRPAARLPAEIAGVVTHELVHCFQHDGAGTCPGGLIEGVADWVRLRCGLAPPHWKRTAADEGTGWDSGYERTAYFLDYLEDRYGDGTVRGLNEKLGLAKYEEKAFWTELVGCEVQQLWQGYRDKLLKGD